jgi:hypothetical protein
MAKALYNSEMVLKYEKTIAPNAKERAWRLKANAEHAMAKVS